MPGLHGSSVKVALPWGGEARVVNSHLTAYPYGPYSIAAGASVASALADEASTREAEVLAILAQLVDAPGSEPGLPTLFVGDHNTPSHLDWTAANADQNFGAVVPWPVSLAVVGAGFRDLFREVHPDPVTARGLTWSPGYPKGSLDDDDVHDRIDMAYLRPGPGLNARAVQAYTYADDPWPADHRAVVVSLERRALVAAPDALSVSLGGTQQFGLDAGPAHAGALYLVLGSLSGTSPGLAIGAHVLPLNAPDAWFDWTLASANQDPLQSTFGALDANGWATASLTLPPGAPPLLTGLTAHHAFAVLDPALPQLLAFASNAEPLALLP